MNLGQGGQGPLSTLATLKEYTGKATGVRSKIVIWFYCECNDLKDLHNEVINTNMINYLEPTYTQRLAPNRLEIDSQIQTRVRSLESQHDENSEEVDLLRHIKNKFVLRNTRDLIGNLMYVMQLEHHASDAYYSENLITIMEAIYSEANRWVKENDGQLIVVRIPAIDRFREAIIYPSLGELRDIMGKDIVFVDLTEKMTNTFDRNEIYFDGFSAHYSENGYKIVIDLLSDQIGLPQTKISE